MARSHLPPIGHATNSFLSVKSQASCRRIRPRPVSSMANSIAGVKYAHIVVAGKDRLENFDFALPMPGPSFVGTGVTAAKLYPGGNIEDLELDALRTTFARQHCCTTNADATRDGDPLNFVIVESKRDPIVPFVARDWHLARTLDVASAIDTARAFLFREAFLTSPVSPLYVFGRREDVVVQKARSNSQRTRPRAVLADAIHIPRATNMDRPGQQGHWRSPHCANLEFDYP